MAMNRERARRIARKFAEQTWPDVERVLLDQFTRWEDPQGHSAWSVVRTNGDRTYVKVTNAGQPEVWRW